MRAIVLTGLYQLSRMRVAEHAAISESVETVRLLGREPVICVGSQTVRHIRDRHGMPFRTRKNGGVSLCHDSILAQNSLRQ